MSTPVWRIVAEREVKVRLHDRTFLLATGFTLVLLVGLFVIMSFVGGGSDEYDVAVARAEDERLVSLAESSLRDGSGDEQARVDAELVADVGAAEELVRDGDVDAALVPGDDGLVVVGDSGVDDTLSTALAGAVSSDALQRNAEEQGVDLAALSEGTTLSERLLDPNADETGARSAVAFTFAIVFLFTALSFGMTIAQSVANEKESRVVELLAAAVPIRPMLWGKIIGNTVLALGQLLLIVAVGIGGLLATGRRELLAGIGPAVGWYVALFVLGFVTLAALWSVAGALVSRQEDLQSTTLPGQLILFVPYFISTFGSEQVQTVASMLPIVSTMVMPGRLAMGEVPWWQLAVGIGLTVLTAVVFVRVGSRIYERTLLRTGGKIGYREALRLAS
jgi:ABC-2 type transport system permease protein